MAHANSEYLSGTGMDISSSQAGLPARDTQAYACEGRTQTLTLRQRVHIEAMVGNL
jgi:hypothetical protein